MIKSIYDEVLEIIDRNIFELPKGFAVLYEIRKKIEQAQKQEKLLELYKELATVRDDMLYCYEAVDFIAYNAMEKKEKNLEKEIKELENDKTRIDRAL